MCKIELPLFALLLTALAGCAKVEYTKASANIPVGTDIGGIAYYESAPYLLVYTDGKGSLTWQILYLPDQTQMRIATPKNFASSLNTTLTFQNGVLTAGNTTVDETAVIKAVATAVQAAIPLLAAADQPYPSAPAINLYKLTFKNNVATFAAATGAKKVLLPLVNTVNTGS